MYKIKSNKIKINNTYFFIKTHPNKKRSKRAPKKFLNMKGSISLNPKYVSLNVKDVKVLKTNPLIACDDRHLYFKGLNKDDILKSVRWEGKNVINCIYLKQYKIILALCQNYKVYALTQNLEEITFIPGWQSNYNIAFDYIEQYNILLMIGAQTIEILRVSIDTNIKKTKFLSSMKFNLKKLTPQPIKANVTLPWNKGYGINIPQNMLYVWAPQSIAFLKLSTLQLLSQSNSLTKKQYPITEVYFSYNFKYTLTGTSCGEIRVWRLPISKLFQHQNILIHVFEAHTKPVKKILQSPYNQKIIMTSAQDLLVCMWSLQTLQMLRKFQFFGLYSQIIIKNINEAYVTKDHILGQLNFGQSLQFITQINSNILMTNQQRTILNEDNKDGTITLTLNENLGVVFNIDLLLNAKELNKIDTKYIYPPLKAKSIKQIIASPFVEHSHYMLSENGQIFKVKVPPFSMQNIGLSSKIQEVFNIQFTMDKEKHPLNQLPTVIYFLKILPPQFDSEIREVQESGKSNRQIKSQKKISISQSIQKYLNLKLLTIGCQKGTIIFVSCDNMNKIFCRLTYHRQSIIFIESIKQYKSSQQKNDFNPINSMIVSYCSQNYLKLIKFNYQKSSAQCILTYYAGPQLKFMRGFNNLLTFVFYKGQFQITQFDNKGKSEDLCCRRSSLIQNHEGEILSIDYQKKLQIIMTVGSDNKIKFWTTKKILIYDILIDDGLSYAFFIPHSQKIQQKPNQNKPQIKQEQKKQENNRNSPSQQQIKFKQLMMRRPKPKPVDFDMIILHSQKLLYFRNIPISFRPNQIQLYNTNPELLDDQKTSIIEVFEHLNHSTNQNQNNNQFKLLSPQKSQYKETQVHHKNRQRIQTQPASDYKTSPLNSKKFFIDESRINNATESRVKGISAIKKLQIKTQTSLQRSYESTKRQHQIPQHLVIRTQKKKQDKYLQTKGRQTSTQSKLSYKSILNKPGLISQSSIDATKKHLQQLSMLKQQINVNKPVLPKIKQKKEQIFDQFMRQKLINKNVLTRRDITINRIIMKNIIKEHFQQQSKMIGLRLDY